MFFPWTSKGHKVYTGVLSFQFVMTLIIGLLTDSFTMGFIVGLFILLLPLALFNFAKEASYTKHAAVIASQLFVALHIQQAMGATYMHFEIFAVMAVTIVYRDWKVVLSSVLFVAIHHVGFYSLQVSGSSVFIFEAQYLMLYILAIHAFFAIAEGVVLGVLAKQSYDDGFAAFELTEAICNIMKDEGKFNINVEMASNNDSSKNFSNLMHGFSYVIDQAQQVSANLDIVAMEVEALSSEVKQASLDTSGQVSTIAAATEEMTVNNQSVSDRALAVNTLSQDARDSSNEAKKVVEDSNREVALLQAELTQTSATISNLAEKCFQIENVMASIKAISEQTNLLALNAAIESARAGEHGRGFAVVADEVRQLAMRTKSNAEQISEITAALISESKLSVDNMQICLEKSGKVSDSSDSAKEMIETVVGNISSVSENISSVSVAIKEQSLVSTEIASSTSELELTSQSLSRNADATGASIVNLKAEILKLRNELTKFN